MIAKEDILIHCRIPGPPYAWQRVGFARGVSYDPNSENKKTFLWQLKAVYPQLKTDYHSRLGLWLKVWTGLATEDGDNFLKFYMDAMQPPPTPKRGTKRWKARAKIGVLMQPEPTPPFAVYGNDSQVDKIFVDIQRNAPVVGVVILVWKLAPHFEEFPAGSTNDMLF